MEQFDDRINLDVFKASTTYQNDYKQFHFTELPPNCDKKSAKEKILKQRKLVLKDNETFGSWRENVHIPFNLHWNAKEVIGTNPYEPFKTPEVPKDTKRDDVIKTRPRIYMSPAVSMDDIADPNVRDLLCNNMYTTETTKSTRESAAKTIEREIPNTTAECGGDPVQLKIDLLPPLPEAFRKGKAWEMAQLKMTVDPIKTFWQNKDPPVRCGACFNPIEGLLLEETKQQISGLISQDKLRLAHDVPIPGYTGYKPRFSGHLPLDKVEMTAIHPFMTVSQAITKKYDIKND